MNIEEVAAEVTTTLEETKVFQPSDTLVEGGFLTVFGRIGGKKNAEKIWMRHAESLVRTVEEVLDVHLIVAKRYQVIGDKFGYLWQISFWAADWEDVLSVTEVLKPKKGVRGEPITLTEVPMRTHAGRNSGPDFGSSIPDRRGAVATKY